MNRFSRFLFATSLCLVASLVGSSAQAQTDRLYPDEGEVVVGKIKQISKDGIVMTVSGKDKSFAVGDIRRVSFQGDPSELTRGRDSVMDGQYDQALDELKQLDIASISRDDIKADALYYLALSQGEMALAGQGDLSKASADAFAFAQNNSNSWHFYSTMRLLGDLAKALGNYEKAAQFYGYLSRAPSMEMKVESVFQGGMVKLAQDDLEGAKTDLGKVAGINATTAGVKQLQTRAKAALAVVLARQGQGEEALKMVGDLIATLNPTDTQTAASIYNAQGASYAAMGDDEGALLAYLHTQLMYSMHATEHVEALKQLAELFNKVGKPDRAAQMRGELQQRYPGLSG